MRLLYEGEAAFRPIFQNQKRGQKKADEMLDVMNKKFCGKHKFKIIEEDKTIRIVEDEGK